MCHNRDVAKPVRFTRQPQAPHRSGQRLGGHGFVARRRGSATAETEDRRWLWVGTDDRGRELEVIAVETDECHLVIHVMPIGYRRGTR